MEVSPKGAATFCAVAESSRREEGEPPAKRDIPREIRMKYSMHQDRAANIYVMSAAMVFLVAMRAVAP